MRKKWHLFLSKLAQQFIICIPFLPYWRLKLYYKLMAMMGDIKIFGMLCLDCDHILYTTIVIKFFLNEYPWHVEVCVCARVICCVQFHIFLGITEKWVKWKYCWKSQLNLLFWTIMTFVGTFFKLSLRTRLSFAAVNLRKLLGRLFVYVCVTCKVAAKYVFLYAFEGKNPAYRALETIQMKCVVNR